MRALTFGSTLVLSSLLASSLASAAPSGAEIDACRARLRPVAWAAQRINEKVLESRRSAEQVVSRIQEATQDQEAANRFALAIRKAHWDSLGANAQGGVLGQQDSGALKASLAALVGGLLREIQGIPQLGYGKPQDCTMGYQDGSRNGVAKVPRVSCTFADSRSLTVDGLDEDRYSEKQKELSRPRLALPLQVQESDLLAEVDSWIALDYSFKAENGVVRSVTVAPWLKKSHVEMAFEVDGRNVTASADTDGADGQVEKAVRKAFLGESCVDVLLAAAGSARAR